MWCVKARGPLPTPLSNAREIVDRIITLLVTSQKLLGKFCIPYVSLFMCAYIFRFTTSEWLCQRCSKAGASSGPPSVVSVHPGSRASSSSSVRATGESQSGANRINVQGRSVSRLAAVVIPIRSSPTSPLPQPADALSHSNEKATLQQNVADAPERDTEHQSLSALYSTSRRETNHVVPSIKTPINSPSIPTVHSPKQRNDSLGSTPFDSNASQHVCETCLACSKRFTSAGGPPIWYLVLTLTEHLEPC